MDTILAQYTQPPASAVLEDREQDEETSGILPPLSLRFALPPVDRVSFYSFPRSRKYRRIYRFFFLLWFIMFFLSFTDASATTRCSRQPGCVP